MSYEDQIRRCTRARNRKQVLDVDLNALPPCESQGQEGTSICTSSLDRQAAQGGGTMQPPAIDLEAYDDDVILSSPAAFAQAKNNSRRNHGCTVVVDVDSEERSWNKRRRVPANQGVINCELYINLEGNSNSATKGGQRATALPPVPLKELTFSCPVCMGPLVEETSTKCGHIFCKVCIKTAISAQSKCPTCRRRTTARDLIRIYLPTTGSA